MSPKQVIKTSNAPDPVGPYNQAIKAGDFIYCSGQIAIDPALNEITCLGDIEKETIQVLKNLQKFSLNLYLDISHLNSNPLFT